MARGRRGKKVAGGKKKRSEIGGFVAEIKCKSKGIKAVIS
jgi:hypothetical protein